MKRLIATLTVLLALGVATVAHASVTSNYNPDTRTQRYGYNTNSNDGRVINRSTSGAFLTYFDNYRVYNFVSETKNSDGTVTRLWQPKKDVAVITDYNSFSYANDGAKVYNFDEFGNQLPEESTDFKSLEFLGEFSINSWTAYRFWK